MASAVLRDRDRKRLKELFYRGYDRSRIDALMKLGDDKLDQEAHFLGEGQHFRAWRLKGAGPGEAALSLVMKRAGRLLGPEDGVARRRWVQAVSKLRGAGGLVPPFEVVETERTLALVMPFGDRPISEAAPHWLPVEERLHELSVTLSSRGLILDDITQGRCFDGIPFVFDLSDVRDRG